MRSLFSMQTCANMTKKVMQKYANALLAEMCIHSNQLPIAWLRDIVRTGPGPVALSRGQKTRLDQALKHYQRKRLLIPCSS